MATQYAVRSRLPAHASQMAVSVRLSARTWSSSASWNVCQRSSSAQRSGAVTGTLFASLSGAR